MKNNNIKKIIEYSNIAFDEIEKAEKEIKNTYSANYTGQLLTAKTKERTDKAVNIYKSNYAAVQHELELLAQKIEKRKAEEITEAVSSEDIKLLSLPISFTLTELQEMGQRNSRNSFILRAISDKAAECKFDPFALDLPTAPDLMAMQDEVRTKVGRMIPKCDDWEQCAHALHNGGLTRAFVENSLETGYGDVEV